jgi:hypothetical protein
MKKHNNICWLFAISLLTISACQNESSTVEYDFNSLNDRIWVGEDFWSVPLEDWSVANGRLEFNGAGQQNTCSILPYLICDNGKTFKITVDMGLIEMGDSNGSSGLIIGSLASEEDDIRAAVYFGTGINIGISTTGYAFIDQNQQRLPEGFDFNYFRLEIRGEKDSKGYVINLNVLDSSEVSLVKVSYRPEKEPSGIIQIVDNFRNAGSKNNGPEFWFDNLSLEGNGLIYKPENRFGPILWAMHTLSGNILKITAQLPPVGSQDNQVLELEVRNENKWERAGREKMDPDSRSVTFRVENWNATIDHQYRILYPLTDIHGNKEIFEYSGTIKKDPVNRQLKMAAMTCQYHTGFPYSPVVKNLRLKEPDILYFSGDQIYEQNGGYPIKREPEDAAILNYLGKWYMFGWAFGDLMRDIPAICTPDDHDVFQGNLWGGGGIARPSGTANSDDLMGFTQTVKMVNVVNTTQCSHLPDPFDPAPVEQDMKVWYTSLTYGRVSFAIVSDRVFKSGPDLVADWEGRKDHLKEPLKDPSVIDRPELVLLGKRQELFLESWIRDWSGIDMKVLLSQTPFANAASHHGQYDGYLLGDLDSGGWPKKARDMALSIIRKGFVFHISGDQHIPSIIQYGIDDFRDAGWGFCTPAIAVGYSRWFRPDELNIPVRNRPEHNHPNTGEYIDAFGNMTYVYAIGNPGDFAGISNRYEMQHNKTAGLGFVIFDKEKRDITMESWHFISDVLHPEEASQHPGWPKTINQMENYGREGKAWLPLLKIIGEPDPVVEITNQSSGELEYIVRINGNEFIPKVFSEDNYSIKVSYPGKDLVKSFSNIIPSAEKGKSELSVEFD